MESASARKDLMLCKFEGWKDNNKHKQQQNFHPDCTTVIVELSGWLLCLQTELAEHISRKLHSQRTIGFYFDTWKRQSCPTTGWAKWRCHPTNPKRRLFTSPRLCIERETSTRTHKEERKGRKSTQVVVARFSNVWQQITTPSLQLINSHVVIDINKGSVCFYF